MAACQTKACFIEPMLFLRTDKLHEGTNWEYELKLDGYRAIAFKSGGRVHLRSRNNKDFNGKYPTIVGRSRLCPMRLSSTARSLPLINEW